MAEPLLKFVARAQDPKKVTKEWSVQSAASVIGVIRWYAHWRRYTFFPAEFTLYDATCMRELAKFCDEQTELRKAERAA